MSLDPDATRLIAASSSFQGSAIELVDAVTGAVLAGVPIFGAGLGVAYPPLPPTLSAQVTGNTVQFDWTMPAHSPLRTATVLEVGFGPGRRDLVTQPFEGVGLLVGSVPPGRYFVRARALDFTGESPVSNEVVVDVP
jgi:hypothetical protein